MSIQFDKQLLRQTLSDAARLVTQLLDLQNLPDEVRCCFFVVQSTAHDSRVLLGLREKTFGASRGWDRDQLDNALMHVQRGLVEFEALLDRYRPLSLMVWTGVDVRDFSELLLRLHAQHSAILVQLGRIVSLHVGDSMTMGMVNSQLGSGVTMDYRGRPASTYTWSPGMSQSLVSEKPELVRPHSMGSGHIMSQPTFTAQYGPNTSRDLTPAVPTWDAILPEGLHSQPSIVSLFGTPDARQIALSPSSLGGRSHENVKTMANPSRHPRYG